MDLFDGSPRERLLLGLMGGAVLLALAWFLLAGRASSPAAAPDTLDDALRDLQRVETGLATRTTTASGPQEPFSRAALIRTSQGAGLTLSRVEPGNDGLITVTFAPAPAAQVMDFLQTVTAESDAVISAFDIEAAAPGDVDARITLRPGP